MDGFGQDREGHNDKLNDKHKGPKPNNHRNASRSQGLCVISDRRHAEVPTSTRGGCSWTPAAFEASGGKHHQTAVSWQNLIILMLVTVR